MSLARMSLLVLLALLTPAGCGATQGPAKRAPSFRSAAPRTSAPARPVTVLYVESSGEQYLQNALKGAGLDVVVAAAADIPGRCEDLGRFGFFILLDTP